MAHDNNYLDPVYPVVRRGLPAILQIARTARARLLRVAKSMRGRPASDIVRRCRLELAAVEPVLARVITDSMLAGWLAGAAPVAREAVSSVAPASSSRAGVPTFAIPGGGASDGEPIVRFPWREKAIHDLRSREILLPGDYEGLAEEAKSSAFTVARAISTESVRRIRDAIADDIDRGGTLREFRAEVADAVGGSLSESQIETLYRTQVGQAHASGLRQALEHPMISDEFPFVAYIATHDDRTRHEHMGMESAGIDGTNVYWRDDPVIQKFWAPWAWSCRCVMVPFTIEDAARVGVREARVWLDSGRPPARRTFVRHPPWDLPRGWPRGGGMQAVAW